MTKVVLIEGHPLMRLGLTQLIRAMPGSWDVVPLDARAVDEFAYLACDVDLVILGMPIELATGWKLLADIERLLRPRRVLLLVEPGGPWQPPSDGLPGSVYGCIASTASVDVVEAAVRLSLSVPELGPASQSTLSTVTAAEPAQLPAGLAGAGTSLGADGKSTPPFETIPAGPAQPVAPDPVTGAQLLNVTPRQYEVLTLLARGYPIKTVSRILNISTATAKAHASTLYQRLRVSSKGEAVYAARQRGIHFD